MRVIAILALGLLLTACQTLQPTTPDWWTSPMADSEQWIYGAGEGYSLTQANQQALANIAGKLKTEISASLSHRTQETTMALDEYADRQLKSTVATVSLSHYETLKTAIFEGKTLTLVRVDRAALAKEWLRQYDATANDVQRIIRNKSDNPFQWWLTAKALVADARSADQLAVMWSGLMSQEKTSHLEDQLNATIDKRKPSVRLSGTQSSINQAIRSSLLEDGLRLGQCRFCDVTLKYQTQFSSDTLFGQNVVNMTFVGTLTDRDGEVSTTRWQVRASSASGASAGKKATQILAVQKLKREGLWKAFGMETN
ncbi:LPP20 family lipoprotein [Marinomonas pollencensis]|uniref:LPP20 lipoprotein n=1 Tax=Marinomonas pollencensis TaxID=491954 RepID=A0A3E0DW46_9GAMM|nr:LPP20 family lipoprotein [Marinomonas pollencensis]REG85889.1 LPP20 lipoprotein [Marinomonas pollencensis]